MTLDSAIGNDFLYATALQFSFDLPEFAKESYKICKERCNRRPYVITTQYPSAYKENPCATID